MLLIRYAAGYVPRALKQKLLKSTHPLKDDLQLCLFMTCSMMAMKI